MIYDFFRLPSSLCWGAALFSRASKIDFVDSTESIFNSGVGAMAFTLVLACAAGMFQVLGKAVSPAIKKRDAVADVVRGLTCLLGSGSACLDVWCMGGVLRPMESSGLGGHFGEPSFFVLIEVQLEVGPGVVCLIFVVPGFDGM